MISTGPTDIDVAAAPADREATGPMWPPPRVRRRPVGNDDADRARPLVITLAVVVLCAAVVFLLVSHFVVAGNGVRVAVVGDSLTAQATWPLVDELNGHGYTSTVAGVSGATIGDQARQLTSLTLPGSSDVVVVALGTNNAFFASVNDARHIDMDRTKRDLHDVMMKLFDGEEGSGFRPSTKCVVWVNVNDHSPLLGLDQMGPAFNQALQSEVDTWRAKGRKVVIADWAATSRNHADWFLQDGVHLTAAGERAYAQLIREHVDRCL